MEPNIDNLKRLIQSVRTIGFWQRLFSWSTVRNQLVDATAELHRLIATTENQARQLQQSRETILVLHTKEEQRQANHDRQTATLSAIQNKIQADRDAEVRLAHASALDRLEKMRSTWSTHQLAIRQSVKALCQKHTIEYVEKVPFRGDPDNAVRIAGEYIIFDAKSPRGDDLGNFPAYLKDQAEKVKKYTGEADVKKWVFFVVPENTLGHISTFVHHLADYQVFIIAANSLEPVLLSLKKVEDYEFAEQLTPEERENICRILGKFAHLSKRRIQIDTYFISQFMELARKCETDLPPDVLDQAIEFEKAEKLNPPLEKRTKTIPLPELEKAAAKSIAEARNQGILPAAEQLTASLNAVPLQSEDK